MHSDPSSTGDAPQESRVRPNSIPPGAKDVSAGGQPRLERDGFGEIEVPAGRLWGAQTERARQNFRIGVDRFAWPPPVIRVLGLVKLCAAEANRDLGVFDCGPGARDAELVAAMIQASREVMEGRWNDDFPLVVFQSGSGTQTHMNANEVIARRCGRWRGSC